MKKTLMTCLILLVSAFFMQNNVFALYTEGGGYVIDSIEEVKKEFAGKARVEGNKITLTSDIDFLRPECTGCQEFEKYDMLNLTGNYILDLNGFTIGAYDFYIEGSLTINDSKGTGQIDVNSLWINESASLTINKGKFQTDRYETKLEEIWENNALVEKEVIYYFDTEIINNGNLIINNGEFEGIIENAESAELNVFNGKFSMISNLGNLVVSDGNINLMTNDGTATINNGNIQSIWNNGNLVIENGKFVNILQEGVAKIKGGTFTAKNICQIGDGEEWCNDYYSQFNVDGQTEITGGVFKSELDITLVVFTYNDYIGDPTVISNLVGEGYLPIYKLSYTPNNNEFICSSFKVVEDNTTLEELMNKLAPNAILTVNSAKPKNDIMLDSLLTSILRDRDIPEGYDVQVGNGDGDFDPENGAIYISKVNGENIRKQVKIVYNEPEKPIVAKTNSLINKISGKIGEESNVDNSFILDDLYLINYLKTSKEETFNYSLALNFSRDLIKLTNGGNIYYRFITRKGDSGTDLWSFLGGEVVVYYNGIAIDATEIGLTSSNVIYIPKNTLDTDDAKIKAALERIKDYLGTTKGITIEVGGLLESLSNDEYDWNEHDLYDEDNCGTKYYNVTINDQTYKFVICKKDILETPVYISNDIKSNISIKSNSSELPLDTAMTVEEVSNDTIKKALGTEKYKAFDITLYSNTKEEKITKLENGKFIVNIPVPQELEGKNIDVFYVNNKGEKVEHPAEVKNNYVIFETNHFSTYALVENTGIINNIEVPKTADVIIGYVILTILSGFGIVFIAKQIKKSN